MNRDDLAAALREEVAEWRRLRENARQLATEADQGYVAGLGHAVFCIEELLAALPPTGSPETLREAVADIASRIEMRAHPDSGWPDEVRGVIASWAGTLRAALEGSPETLREAAQKVVAAVDAWDKPLTEESRPSLDQALIELRAALEGSPE